MPAGAPGAFSGRREIRPAATADDPPIGEGGEKRIGSDVIVGAQTFLGVALLLLATVALLANLIPARRAAEVDPLVALRYEQV